MASMNGEGSGKRPVRKPPLPQACCPACSKGEMARRRGEMDLQFATMQEMYEEMQRRFPERVLLTFTERHSSHSLTHVVWHGDPISGMGMAEYAKEKIRFGLNAAWKEQTWARMAQEEDEGDEGDGANR